jgi:hypothetical protein
MHINFGKIKYLFNQVAKTNIKLLFDTKVEMVQVHPSDGNPTEVDCYISNS